MRSSPGAGAVPAASLESATANVDGRLIGPTERRRGVRVQPAIRDF
jgi:hypothetical protein